MWGLANAAQLNFKCQQVFIQILKVITKIILNINLFRLEGEVYLVQLVVFQEYSIYDPLWKHR